ncbi:hypothetical protein ACO2Q8_07905 [Larkinella sp. VNQ87]|uniref:hypothetical protein n=1 Tax=Larkinella sp. VNQ87 TaxID=3400921 RepID=UPI003C101F35
MKIELQNVVSVLTEKGMENVEPVESAGMEYVAFQYQGDDYCVTHGPAGLMLHHYHLPFEAKKAYELVSSPEKLVAILTV